MRPMSITEQTNRPLITTPSLTSMATLIDTVVTERVAFITPTGKDAWMLERLDGSTVPGFNITMTEVEGWPSYRLFAA